MEHEEAMRAILSGNEGITVRDLFVRTMRLMGEEGNPDEIARACGFDPDDLVYRGEIFKPTIRAI